MFGPGSFFVEVQNNGVTIQHECEERSLDLARRMGLPVVATSDVAGRLSFGYTSNEVGFGWTNGVAVELMDGLGLSN